MSLTVRTSHQNDDHMRRGKSKMSSILIISAYFVLSLMVTISNAEIVQEISCPALLTVIHTSTTLVAAAYQGIRTRHFGCYQPHLTKLQHLQLMLFSALFSLNIGISNLSLDRTSLPLNQLIRATAPVLTILLSTIFRLRAVSAYNYQTYLALIPIVIGVGLATYGDRYEASAVDLGITFGGAVLAALKTILTHHFTATVGLQSVKLIWTVTPFALLESLGAAIYAGEVKTAWALRFKLLDFESLMFMVAFNAVLAAALNMSSFEANRRCGPVSMAIAGNLKQVAIVAIRSRATNGVPGHLVLGTSVTCAGSLWYAWAGREEAKKADEKLKYDDNK